MRKFKADLIIDAKPPQGIVVEIHDDALAGARLQRAVEQAVKAVALKDKNCHRYELRGEVK